MWYATIYGKCKNLQDKTNTQIEYTCSVKIVQRQPIGPARVCALGEKIDLFYARDTGSLGNSWMQILVFLWCDQIAIATVLFLKSLPLGEQVGGGVGKHCRFIWKILLGKTLSEGRGESISELALRGGEKKNMPLSLFSLLCLWRLINPQVIHSTDKHYLLPRHLQWPPGQSLPLSTSHPPSESVSPKSIALTVYPQIFILFCIKFDFCSSFLAPACLSIPTHLLS